MVEHLNFRVNFKKANYSSNLVFPPEDKKILRELGKTVSEIASSPEMGKKKELWILHNKLAPTRPLILADPENGWNEIITQDQIKCTHSVSRLWEIQLRKHIFWGKEMGDDFVVEPYFNLPHVYTEKPWRLKGAEDKQTKKEAREDGGAYHIETILEDYAMLDFIEPPEITIDWQKTNQLFEQAQEIFDGYLEVQLNTVWFWSVGLTDDYAFLRGLEKLMYDFYDAPDQVHSMMEILKNGTVKQLEFLETNSLLSLNNDGTFVGSGGIGYTDQLPQNDFTGKARLKDMWGLGESQITVGLSPEMFKEFIFPYQKEILLRFGLTCYGCCEPLDERFDIVKEIPTLRRISVSPWATKEVMGEKLGSNYIYSAKPSPSYLALPVLNEDAVREELHTILSIAKRNNNHLEFIMKDNHTLGHNPENIKRWVAIAREESASAW